MKKLFISQPMRGKTDEEILAVRAQAIQSAERVLGEDVEVIDSFIKAAVVSRRIAEAAVRRGCCLLCRWMGRCTRMQNRARVCH